MKKRILKISVLVLSLIVSIVFIYNTKFSKTNIETILKSDAYSYLPVEAKEYVEEVFNKTGEVILTEKNKENNKVYLNPQYVEYLTYSDEEKSEFGEIPVPMIIDYQIRDNMQSIDLPSKYDLRDIDGKNFVTPVRNQGNLGICWAFASAGAVESHLLKKKDVTYTSSEKLISERQMDYATSKNGIKDYKSEYVSFVERNLGDGGNFYISTIAMANGVSLIDYKSFKAYNDKDLSKMELHKILNYENSNYEVNTTINMPVMDLRESTGNLTNEQKELRNSYLQEVKQNIMENGAAYVGTLLGMNGSCEYFDSTLNNTVIDVYNCHKTGGHAMEIIGWDDDIEYSYCGDTYVNKSDTSNCGKIVSGKGVWILKNSWGSETPYPYLTYDSLNSSISFIKDLESKETKEWENNYIVGEGDYHLNSLTFNLDNTKINNDEKIEKIKFIVAENDATFNIKIKKKDGTFEIFSVTNELPGLVTLNITKDVFVNKDTEITIEGEKKFINKVSVFTTNVDGEPYINLDKINGLEINYNEVRLYSETKNIPSNTQLTYKLYDSNNQVITDKVTFTNNIVAENNINTLMTFSKELDGGTYRIDVIYNSNVIGSTSVNIIKIQGTGIETDPYIITNPYQLSKIRDDLDAYYELGNDIDLTEVTSDGGSLSELSEYCPQGFGWEAINGFSGSLDGKGHTIKGLKQRNYIKCNDGITSTWSNTGNGLFGSAYGNVTIKNLVLEDFEIICQNGYCGILLSNYISNNNDYNDKNEYNAVFENIVLRNSKVSAKYVSNHNYGGGLFGYLNSRYGNISISNIYLDLDKDVQDIKNNAFLASTISSNKSSIKDIQLTGNYTGGVNDSILVNEIYTYGNNGSLIKNVLSTLTASNVSGNLINVNTGTRTLSLDSLNILSVSDKGIGDDYLSKTNINEFDKNTQLIEFTKQENYSTWENFNDNWVMKTIDGIPRIPVLKIVDFEYTKINDISIKHELNNYKDIHDYVMLNIKAAKNISFKSNDENIVKLDELGHIIPQSSGHTTIHIESYYDGYIKDVPISVEYKPHYTVHFNSNDGEGSMDSFEIETGTKYKLPANIFTKVNYEFNGWNTKADGTGTAYSDLDEIISNKDKEEITLYAQWIGKQITINFKAMGGTMPSTTKTLRYGDEFGELPLPVKTGFGFNGWNLIVSSGVVSSMNAFSILEYTHVNTAEASWRSNAYTIIYDANGGEVKEEYKEDYSIEILSKSLATTYANNNSNKKLYKNIYEKPDYLFKEWNTKSDGTGTPYTEEQTINLNNVENDTLRLYAIWEKEIGYEISDDYIVDETNSYIGSITYKTTVDELKNKITLDPGYTLDIDYKEINSKHLLYTGGKTKIYKNGTLIIEYTNIVTGDTNGDGKMNVSDIVKINNHIVDDTKKLNGIYSLAGDYNGDGKLNIQDIVKINNAIVGGN